MQEDPDSDRETGRSPEADAVEKQAFVTCLGFAGERQHQSSEVRSMMAAHCSGSQSCFRFSGFELRPEDDGDDYFAGFFPLFVQRLNDLEQLAAGSSTAGGHLHHHPVGAPGVHGQFGAKGMALELHQFLAALRGAAGAVSSTSSTGQKQRHLLENLLWLNLQLGPFRDLAPKVLASCNLPG